MALISLAPVWKSRVRQALVLAAASSLMLAVAACGSTATTAATTKPTTAATTTKAAATTSASQATTATTAKPATTASSTPSSAATSSPTTTILLTEPQMAYVTSVSNASPAVVQVDYVEMYFGAEALAKAKQDKSPIVEKDAAGKEYIPNDYYLRNTNPQLRSFPLAANCLIEMLPPEGGADATEVVSVSRLRTLVSARKRLVEITFNPAGTQIVGLTEFFVP